MIQAVIFNLESTVLDPGGLRLSQGMNDLFRWMGVDVGPQDIKRGRGLTIREHIASTLRLSDVRSSWINRFGTAPGRDDVERIYSELVPVLRSLLQSSTPCSGLDKALQDIRDRRIQSGATSAFTNDLLDGAARRALQNTELDCTVTPCEVNSGRPFPWMVFENAHRMQVYPLSDMVKVGDTVADMQEGRNAGVWTIGVLDGFMNRMDGIGHGDEGAENQRKEAAYLLKRAGAHLIMDSLADLPRMLREIEMLQHTGGRP
ncbi:HAD hydrolase-like protein [Paenibacillus sp. P96]|uniref:HAD hydrolase-like protein n=1 Tax=Paenibacillus zeirhizosphaerae TaxID=2987519 RepID=A0ABT9FMV3_9BACL|nr:HAD family hydrolase [Paenibacillus sp. P96]MDP4095994.1 HAD hydrolase-like protein [Paenibacillus sp. P96]